MIEVVYLELVKKNHVSIITYAIDDDDVGGCRCCHTQTETSLGTETEAANRADQLV